VPIGHFQFQHCSRGDTSGSPGEIGAAGGKARVGPQNCI